MRTHYQLLPLLSLLLPLLLAPDVTADNFPRHRPSRLFKGPEAFPGTSLWAFTKPGCTTSPSLILVTTTSDAGPGSLRQALDDANNHAGPDSIAFNIPKSDPGFNSFINTWTIKPLSQLPLLTDDGTIIEGESQKGFFPGANPSGPAIELDGSLAGSPVAGLSIICAHTWVHDIAINRFSDDGIIIAGPTHSYNVIYACYIGVTPDGKSKAANLKSGIDIMDADHNWMPLPDMAPNVIGANEESGITIRGLGSQFNYVGPNFIGTDPLYIQDLGNSADGITIKNGATDNAIGMFFFPFNVVVWNNRQAGIRVSGSSTLRNLIGAGSVTRNGGPGILLENGGNNSMLAPVITQVTIHHITAQAPPNSFVGFFRDGDDEGEELLGLGFTDALGNVSFSGPVRGPYVTAVTIDTTSGATRYNSSAFSTPIPFATRIEVTNTNDSGPGSLREAIADGNTRPGPDSITFAIPTSDPGYISQLGTWTIKPLTPLPSVVDRETVIEGFSQNEFLGHDANPLGPEIEVDGSLLGYYAGIYVFEHGSGSVIQGLLVSRCELAGIYISEADSTQVVGCYIGTDARGLQSAPNGAGIYITGHAHNSWIGRTQSRPGNLISGNTYNGIQIDDSSTGTIFRSNIIGLDRTLTRKLGNGIYGIRVGVASGGALMFDNWVGGNYLGIAVEGESHSCIIEGNMIGTDTSCTSNLGNSTQGIDIVQSQQTAITGNCIGYNGGYGVSISGSTALYNQLSRNRICHHDAQGIFNSNGGNSEYSPPTITGLAGGILNGTAQAYDNIEVFADSVDEAEFFVGGTQADPGGHWTLTLGAAPLRRFLTATAKDGKGNTSCFSAPFDYVAAGVPEQQVAIPGSFALQQNYPNPFNPKTVVGSQLPVVSNVRIVIYDLLGREVAVVVNERRPAGFYEDSFDARGLASGVYVYRMTAGSFVQSRKMVLAK
jgi:hypothetical protein